MRIGIDVRALASGTGVAQYTKTLIKEYLSRGEDDEYILFCDGKKEVEEFAGKGVTIMEVKRGKIPILGTHGNMSAACSQAQIDVLHSPTGSVPLFWRGKTIITIHDLAIYDHPEWFPSGQWWSTHIVVPRSIRRAEKIIAVSDDTKQKIRKRFHVPAAKIEVRHEHVEVPKIMRSDVDVLRHFQLPKYFILFLGTLEPRKNIVRLIEAFCVARKNFPPDKKSTQLILAGKLGWKSEETENTLQKNTDSVRHIGFVSEEEKWALLRSCQFLAFISLEEGFGLPLVEARAVHTPVLASDIPVFHEVAGDYPTYVDPLHTKTITKKIEELLCLWNR